MALRVIRWLVALKHGPYDDYDDFLPKILVEKQVALIR